MAPGSSLVWTVSFDATISGSSADFDSAAYIANVAALTAVPASDISLTITETARRALLGALANKRRLQGSFTVTTTIIAPTPSAVTVVQLTIASAVADNTLATTLGVTASFTAPVVVLAVAAASPPPPTPPVPSPPETLSLDTNITGSALTDGSSSTADDSAGTSPGVIAVIVIVVILLLCAVVGGAMVAMKSKKPKAEPITAKPVTFTSIDEVGASSNAEVGVEMGADTKEDEESKI